MKYFVEDLFFWYVKVEGKTNIFSFGPIQAQRILFVSSSDFTSKCICACPNSGECLQTLCNGYFLKVISGIFTVTIHLLSPFYVALRLC